MQSLQIHVSVLNIRPLKDPATRYCGSPAATGLAGAFIFAVGYLTAPPPDLAYRHSQIFRKNFVEMSRQF
jgi:hypothetical protein